MRPIRLPGYFSLLFLLSLIVMLVMAGESMLTAALVDIEHEFSVPGIYESWVLPLVLLVGAVASPFVGTVGDRFGHKRLLLICLGIYLIGLFFGYGASDIWVLLLGRALQGAGIAAFPLAYAIIRAQMGHPAADMGIGVISAMYGAGTFIGVIVGSFISGIFSWRMTYLVLIPVTILLMVLVFIGIKENHPGISAGVPDWAGFISLLIFLILLLTFVSLPGSEVISSFAVFLGAGSIASLVFFIWNEHKVPHPLADFQLFRRRSVFVLMVIGFLTMFAYFILLQMMPYVIRLPTGLSLSTELVGLILVPGTICDMFAGSLTGRMVPRIGFRLPCIVGSLLLGGAGLILFLFPLSVQVLILAWMLFAFGMSVLATADLIGVLDFVGLERTAEATGLIQSMQTLGGMAGPIMAGILLATSESMMTIHGESWMVPHTETFYLGFLWIIGIGLALFILSWRGIPTIRS